MESYSHIVLSEDDIVDAMIWAKRKKENLQQEQALRERESAVRKIGFEAWSFDMIKTFMMKRAGDLFKETFTLDDNNEGFFNLLCYYFINSNTFLSEARKFGEENPSLSKGIFIPGNFGTGKTWLMKLFQKNQKQVYFIRSSKDVAQAYLISDDKTIPDEFITPFKNAINDASVFYQPISGLCIDDMGAESKKNNYGNVVNVIGDLIEQRYFRGYTGTLLHGTTNLSADELKAFYGERVTSRMREIFNFIELPGNDRRK